MTSPPVPDRGRLVDEVLRRRGLRKGGDRIGPAPVREEHPLSFGQERLWFLDGLTRREAVYHMPVVLRLSGALDASALESAIWELEDRHEALRAFFPVRDGAPVQKIYSDTGAPLRQVDLRERPDVERVRLESLLSTGRLQQPG